MAYFIRFQDRSVIVPDYTPLIVEKDPRTAAIMEACNLKPGLRATLETDYIPTENGQRPIDGIEEALETIPVYRAVKSTVFRRDREGREATVLRHALFTGSGSSEGLESKIFADAPENDFTPDEYNAVAKTIHGLLEKAAAEGRLRKDSVVELSTIRDNWLRGVTYFPQNWENLGILSEQFPGLGPHYESYRVFPFTRGSISESRDYFDALRLDSPDPNLFGAYLLYKGIRSVEARLVSQPIGEGSASSSRERGDSLFRYKDITEKMAAYLQERISTKHSLSVVLEARRLEDKTGAAPKEIPNPNFTRGVYIGKGLPPGTSLTFIEPQTIYNEYILLDRIFKMWYDRFANAVAVKIWGGLRDAPLVRSLVKDTASTEIGARSPTLKALLDKNVGKLEPPMGSMFAELRDAVNAAIESYFPEHQLGVSPGLYRRLMRKFDEVRRFLPHEAGEIAYLMYEGPGGLASDKGKEGKRRLQDGVTRLQRRMTSKFGIDTAYSNVDIIYEDVAEKMDRINRGKSAIEQIRFSMNKRKMIIQLVREILLRAKVIRYSQVSESLESMGLEELLPKFFDRKLHEEVGML